MNYLLQDGFKEAYKDWCQKNKIIAQPRPPLFNGGQLRLEDLWKSVQALGGSRRVSEGRRWATIGRMFNPPPTMTNFSYRIKQLYAEHLLDFERSIDPERAMLAPVSVTRERRMLRSKRPITEGVVVEISPVRRLCEPEMIEGVSDGWKKRRLSSSPISPHLTSRRATEINFEMRLESLEKMVARVESKIEQYSMEFLSILADIKNGDDS